MRVHRNLWLGKMKTTEDAEDAEVITFKTESNADSSTRSPSARLLGMIFVWERPTAEGRRPTAKLRLHFGVAIGFVEQAQAFHQ
jgi:hypothetical protein